MQVDDLSAAAAAGAGTKRRQLLNYCVIFVALGAVILHSHIQYRRLEATRDPHYVDTGLCRQLEPLRPPEHEAFDAVFERLFQKNSSAAKEYLRRVADNLGGFVRYRTVSIPSLLPREEQRSRKEAFRGLHRELDRRYPLVHKYFQKERISNFSLLYYLPGSNPSLPPMLLTAHLDVVPVVDTTIDEWQFDPFSGKVEGGYVWGRGARDDKLSMTAMMDAMELLLESGLRRPSRGILMGFGHDEELGGMAGARAIAQHLRDVKGISEVFFLVDEGPAIVELRTDAAANLADQNIKYRSQVKTAEKADGDGGYTTFALVGMAEKGKVTATFQIDTAGGDSSNPPPHTSVGLMSMLVRRIEGHQFVPDLSQDNPLLETIECLAAHLDLSRLSFWERFLASQARRLRSVVAAYVSRRFPNVAANFWTTTAVTVVRGGVTANVLPSSTKATVNFRIAMESSLMQVRSKIVTISKSFAKTYGIMFYENDVTHSKVLATTRPVRPSLSHSGVLRVSISPGSRDPSRITPRHTDAYRLLAGTIRGVFGGNIVVAPALLIANTDSWHYFRLTQNAFRFTPVVVKRAELPSGIHDVNEVVSVAALRGAIGFFFQLVRNAATG